MFIQNLWYLAAWSRELAANTLISRTVADEPLVLFRTSNGQAAALRDNCCHRNAPLSLGRCEGDTLRCGYHGLRFDVRGQCVEIPGQVRVPPGCRVPAYPLVEKGGCLWVWMGDPGRAQPELIPNSPGVDSPEWDMRVGVMDFEASYLLINDNLCDFSHVAYVHEATFGGGDDRLARTHPRITSVERGIRVERWLTDRGKIEKWLPTQAETVAAPRLDQWLTYDYLAPGVLIMRVEIHEAGSAVRHDFRAPQCEPIHSNFSLHAITPVTEHKSRYHFSLGPRASEARVTPGLGDEMFSVALRAFEEDRIFIEAQQRNLHRWPINPLASIQHDRGVHLMRAVLDKLLAQEKPERRRATEVCETT
jgi:vanillate O-demethylase monooxygenase subunit